MTLVTTASRLILNLQPAPATTPDPRQAVMQQPQQDVRDRPMSFEKFIELHPKNADSKLNQLAEVTGMSRL
jgi:hypothetical protein